MKKSILKTYKQVEDWFSETDSHIFAVDTELVDISQLNMKIVGISFCDGERACYIDWILDPCDEIRLIYFLEDIINKSTIIFHNAPFDLRVLHNYKLGVPRDIFCTMTAAHLINENQRKGLKFLAAKYLGATDTMTFEDASADGFHTEKFYRYALNDVVWTWQLYKIFSKELEVQQLEKLFYDIEMPFQYCLCDLAINGIAVDREELIKLQEKMIGVVEDLRIKMCEAGGISDILTPLPDNTTERKTSLNINSPKQLADFIRFNLGIGLTQKTKGGDGYCTDKNVLNSIKHKHKFIRLLLEYRTASKLLNSFLIPLPTLIEADGRIRVNFHNTVAVTGRVSASRLHQLPKENTGPVPVRQCFIPAEGKVLICADYAGQELRVLGHVSKDPTMIDAFKNKIDVHFMIANIFFDLGIPPEALVETHKDYKKYRKKFKNERDKIKTVNFGIAYGKTAYGFAKDWNIPVPEAEKFIEGYFKRFPNIKKAISKCTFLVKQQKAIRNLTGRVRRFGRWVSHRQFRQAFNFLIQSASADMMKKAAGDFREVCLKHSVWKCLFVLTLHDELVYEVKKEYAEEIRVALKHAMENAIELCMPLVADVGIGNNYSEAKL